MVKNVSKGDKITAFWANSLVNEVNNGQGIKLGRRSIPSSNGHSIQMASEPAFQIRYSMDNQFTLNTGQIYLDGVLIESLTD